MPFKKWSEVAPHYGRRVLISGPPNTLKTTATMTWPAHRHHVSYPGEKGFETLPRNSPDMTPWIWEAADPAKLSPHSVVQEIETLTIEILAGKHGECTTFVGDGLHKLYCVTPDQRVLLDDLRWVPAGDIKPGDSLLGFDEKGPRRRYRTAEAVGCETRKAPVFRVVLSDGSELKATGEHPWITRRQGNRQLWTNTANLRLGDVLPKFFEPWTVLRTYEAGWLAALFDGEGHVGIGYGSNLGPRLGFAQKPGAVLDHALDLLQRFGIPYWVNTSGAVHQVLIGAKHNIARLLGMIRPVRLQPKVSGPEWGALRSFRYATVEAVEALGEREIVTMGTSTGTYIAEGFGSHNTWYYERAWLDLGQTEENVGRAYGKAHRDFSAYLNKVLQSPVPYCVMTVWEGRTKDDPDNKAKTAPTHIFPDLPGEMAKRIVGEFSVVLYAECDPPDPQGRIRARWQIRPAGKVWGVGVKLPPEMAAKLPSKLEPPDFSKLEPLLKS